MKHHVSKKIYRGIAVFVIAVMMISSLSSMIRAENTLKDRIQETQKEEGEPVASEKEMTQSNEAMENDLDKEEQTEVSTARKQTRSVATINDMEDIPIVVDGVTFQFDFSLNESTATLTDIANPSESRAVSVPETVTYDGKEYTVTALSWANPIWSGANRRNNVSSLQLPATLMNVDYVSFYKFPSLTTITIPGSVKEFNGSFQYCSKLKEIIFEEGVEVISSNNMIGSCESLETIQLPSTLKKLKEPAIFSEAKSLKSITLPEGIEIMEGSTFRDCTSLESITLPKSITSIKSFMFSGCSSLKTISFQGDITEVGNRAFSGCTKLTTLPDLTKLTSIGDSAFENCTSLTGEIDLSHVSVIDYGAFSGCTNISGTVDLSNITEIKGTIFQNTGITGVIFNDTLTEIGSSAFNNTKLTSVTLPKMLKSIGNSAFANTAALSGRLEIPDSVTSLGEKAFYKSAFEEVSIGSGLKEIKKDTFTGNTALKKIVVNNSKDEITGLNTAVPTGIDVTYLIASIGDVKDTINDETNVTLQDAVNNAEDGKETEITLGKHIKLSNTLLIPANKQIVLTSEDAYTITAEESNVLNSLIKIQSGGQLTLKGQITLTGRYILSSDHAAMVDCEGSFRIEENAIIMGMTVSDSNTGAVKVHGEQAMMIMNGGSIQRNKLIDQYAGAVYVGDGGSFHLQKGAIEQNTCTGTNNHLTSAGIYIGEGGYVKMSGGQIKNNTGYRGTAVFMYSLSGNQPAEFDMTGGEIAQNESYTYYTPIVASGAVHVEANSIFHMSNGSITENVANGNGGGVALTMDSTFEPEFVMDGGNITNNKASGNRSSGGGIYSFSNKVVLHAGRISGNSAVQGGGIYSEGNDNTYSTMHISNAIITNNKASQGGGMWFCPTGETSIHIKDGIAVYNNRADGAGDDFANGQYSSGGDYRVTLADRMLGGGKLEWYKDGGLHPVVSGAQTSVNERIPRYGQAEADDTVVHVKDTATTYALKAMVKDDAAALANKKATLFITDNTAVRGGGIGANGGVDAGTQDENYLKTMTIEKIWEHGDAPIPDQVTVQVCSEGYTLEEVVLSKANNWKQTLQDIPADIKDITIKESKVEGYQMQYDIKRNQGNYQVVIKNTRIAPETAVFSIQAEKQLDGKAAQGHAFTFVLKDEKGQIIQTKNNEDGKILFDDLIFDKAQTYTYTLEEKAQEDRAIRYDASVYKVQIKVIEKKDGYQVDEVIWIKDGQVINTVPQFFNYTKETESPENNEDKDAEKEHPTGTEKGEASAKPEGNKAQTKDSAPTDTSDTTQKTSLLIGMLAAAGGILLLIRKRKAIK